MARMSWVYFAVVLAAAACMVVALTSWSAESQAGEPQEASPVQAADESSQGDAAQPTTGLGAAVAPLFSHDVETYTVTVTAGASGNELSVVPKAGFHVNTLYPWKYQSPDKTYKRDEFELTEERAALSLVAGEDGELRFSVCNDQTCLIEKVAVTVAAPAP